MATNPMQKKARNSFLLGMLLMLIIAAVVIVFLFVFLKKDEKKQEEEEVAKVNVYVVAQNIASGEEITIDKLKLMPVDANIVPANAYGTNDTYDRKVGEKEIKGLYYYIKDENDEEQEAPRYRAKIALKEGTVLNNSMMYEGEQLGKSERIQEYNMLQLPIQLDIGEYVDVRLQMSNGQDFIVVSHKEVIDITEETIWLQLSEEEIVLMSNAIVEAYISQASNIYVTKYVEPGMQGAATVTYVPSDKVINLISQNENIVQEAKVSLVNKYNNGTAIRDYINSELDIYSEIAIDNIETSMIEAREKAKEQREIFLNGVE